MHVSINAARNHVFASGVNDATVAARRRQRRTDGRDEAVLAENVGHLLKVVIHDEPTFDQQLRLFFFWFVKVKGFVHIC